MSDIERNKLVEVITTELDSNSPTRKTNREFDEAIADAILAGFLPEHDEAVRREAAAEALSAAANDFDQAARAGVEPALNRLAAILLRRRAENINVIHPPMIGRTAAIREQGTDGAR